MYLISNPKDRDIKIEDLGLVLGRKQAMDLHRIKLKIMPENSNDLRNKIKNGDIKLLKRDNVNNNRKEEIPISTGNDELLKDIQKGIKKIGDNSEVIQAINNLTSVISNMKVVNNISSNDIFQEKDIDSKTLIKIHAKAMDKRISPDISGSINYQETETSNDSINKNADELDNLLA